MTCHRCTISNSTVQAWAKNTNISARKTRKEKVARTEQFKQKNYIVQKLNLVNSLWKLKYVWKFLFWLCLCNYYFFELSPFPCPLMDKKKGNKRHIKNFVSILSGIPKHHINPLHSLSKNRENLHLPCLQSSLYQTTQQCEHCVYCWYTYLTTTYQDTAASLRCSFARHRLSIRSLAERAVSTTAQLNGGCSSLTTSNTYCCAGVAHSSLDYAMAETR